jgi:peptidoglycan/xylan/chitin deacetylase (PgdA/CDA1 family)
MSTHFREFVGVVFFVYAILPTVLVHFWHTGVYWQGQPDSTKVALTFDDGPDPIYTPQILDILHQYNAKATFFVVGKHVKKYPDLVKRILSEGHSIGVHGYHHRFACLMDPFSSIWDIKKGAKAIREIIGDSPFLFRPAWGAFNLCSLMYILLRKEKAIMWSFFAKDWEIRATPESIFNQVVRRIRAGSVVVFHDRSTKPGAAPDGPAKTIEALPEILKDIQGKGLQPVSIEDLLEFHEGAMQLHGTLRDFSQSAV